MWEIVSYVNIIKIIRARGYVVCIRKKGIERHCKPSEALRCNEFSIDKDIINANCDYLSYITYNIWKKGMGNEGIDYIKGKVAQ